MVSAALTIARPTRITYADVITQAWQKIASHIIEIGECLLRAKAELRLRFTKTITELNSEPRT